MKRKHRTIILKREELRPFTKKGYSMIGAIELALHKHDYYIDNYEWYYKEFKTTIHVFVMF